MADKGQSKNIPVPSNIITGSLDDLNVLIQQKRSEVKTEEGPPKAPDFPALGGGEMMPCGRQNANKPYEKQLEDTIAALRRRDDELEAALAMAISMRDLQISVLEAANETLRETKVRRGLMIAELRKDLAALDGNFLSAEIDKRDAMNCDWIPSRWTEKQERRIMDKNTAKVLSEVGVERHVQDEKWGEQNHNPFVYLAILGEEYGESCQAAVEFLFGNASIKDLRGELIQTAAVAVAMVECLDRGKFPLDQLARFGDKKGE